MSLFKKLFGGGPGGSNKPDGPFAEEAYEGYRVLVTPIPEGSQFRLAATIEKDVDGEVKQHRLIRADVLPSKEAAAEAAIRKARQLIDSQGDALFD
ncbi:MAG: HlyU family transcriptional regulator [Pseudomonadota bacterium]